MTFDCTLLTPFPLGNGDLVAFEKKTFDSFASCGRDFPNVADLDNQNMFLMLFRFV